MDRSGNARERAPSRLETCVTRRRGPHEESTELEKEEREQGPKVVLAPCEPVCEEWVRVAVEPVGAKRGTTRAPRRVLRMHASVKAGARVE